MEETRTSLTEKLEALETKVTDKVVQPVADAVEKAADVACNIVETVKDTVSSVTEKVQETTEAVTSKVQETTQAVASAFDLRKQVAKHPWVAFGVAATAGCMVGSFLGRRAQRGATRHETTSWSRPKHVKGTNGASHHVEASPLRRAPKREPSEQESWIRDQMRHLGKLAISALMSTVRDLVKRNIPGPMGERIGAEVESMTTSLGAEPIRGDVVGPIAAKAGNGKEKPEPVNRLRTGGSREGMY